MQPQLMLNTWSLEAVVVVLELQAQTPLAVEVERAVIAILLLVKQLAVVELLNLL
jgi:hypothetical protein